MHDRLQRSLSAFITHLTTDHLIDIHIRYYSLSQTKSWAHWYFENAPTCFSYTLRDAIESKICEGYFIHVHKLPVEFNFATYMCKSCIRYVMKLVEVAPVNWVIVIVLATLNYARVALIDSVISDEDSNISGCEEVKVTTEQRRLAIDDNVDDHYETKTVCFDYLVETFFLAGCGIVFINLILMWVSHVLYHRLMWRIYVHFDEMCLLNAGVSILQHTAIQDNVEKEDDQEAADATSVGRVGEESANSAEEESAGKGANVDVDSGDIEAGSAFPSSIEMGEKMKGSQSTSSFIEENEAGDVVGELMNDNHQQPGENGDTDSDGDFEGDVFDEEDAEICEDKEAIEWDLYQSRRFYESCLVLIAEEAERSQAEQLAAAAEQRDMEAEMTTHSTPSSSGTPFARSEAIREKAKSSFHAVGTFPLAPTNTNTQRLASMGKNPRRGVSRYNKGNMSKSIYEDRELGTHGFRRLSKGLRTHMHLGVDYRPPSYHQGRKPHHRLMEAFAKFGESPMRRTSSVLRQDEFESTELGGSNGSIMSRLTSFLQGKGHDLPPPSPLAARTVSHKSMTRTLSVMSRSKSLQAANERFKHSKESEEPSLYRPASNSFAMDHADRKDQLIDWNLRVIFPPGYSTIYYRTVSVLVLLQAVYVALWVTDFTSVAEHSQNPILWQALLALPIALNFFCLYHNIFKSSIIRSMTHRNADILDEIVEEAREQVHVARDLRAAIVEHLTFLEIPRSLWKEHLWKHFQIADTNGSHEIDSEEFLMWFRAMDVHFSRKTTKRIFNALDRDKSGAISWKEMEAIIFPEFQNRTSTRQLARVRSLGQTRGKSTREALEKLQAEEADADGAAAKTGRQAVPSGGGGGGGGAAAEDHAEEVFLKAIAPPPSRNRCGRSSFGRHALDDFVKQRRDSIHRRRSSSGLSLAEAAASAVASMHVEMSMPAPEMNDEGESGSTTSIPFSPTEVRSHLSPLEIPGGRAAALEHANGRDDAV